MRLLVCGGRTFSDAVLFERRMTEVDAAYRVTCVVEGFARGADTMARLWAIRNGRELATFPADWATYGRAAGAIRNAQMLEVGRPDLVLAFPGGPGTRNMAAQAQRAGVPVWWARPARGRSGW